MGLTTCALAAGESRRLAIRRAHDFASEPLLDDVEDDLLARAPADLNILRMNH